MILSREKDLFEENSRFYNRLFISFYSFLFFEIESKPPLKIYKLKDLTTGKIFLANYTQIVNNENISQVLNDTLLIISKIMKLNHPCILKCFGCDTYYVKDDINLAVITEYTQKNNLKDFIHDDSYHFNDTLKLIMIYGIASGMKYLHLHDIIHNDLNLSNIHLDTFFLPKIVNHLNSKIDSSHCNTKETSKIDKESNVYSFGFIVSEIMTNRILINISEKSDIEKLPLSYQNLINSCMMKEPCKRPTFDDILVHLRSDHGFITEKVNENDFRDFVHYVDESIDKYRINQDQFINFFSITFTTPRIANDEKKIDEKEIEIDLDIKEEEVIDLDIKEEEVIDLDIKKEKFIDINRFLIIKILGSGSFGRVFQVKEIQTGKIFAAKMIKKYISSDYKTNDETLNFFREVKLMSAFNHPSIIKFIGYSPIDFQGFQHPTTIIEFASNGSLRDVINLEASGLSPKNWNETKKLIIIYGIASAMLYLHSHDVIHRDLKPDNILMDDYLFPKVTDFRYSKALINKKYKRSLAYISSPCIKGTFLYISPESFMKKLYSKENDIFAFAILVYEVLTLKKPYPFDNYYELLSKVICKGERPELIQDIPNAFQKLLMKCWNKDPDQRPSFEEIVDDLQNNSDYITECIDENEYHEYIEYIQGSKNSFDLSNSIRFGDLAKWNRKDEIN